MRPYEDECCWCASILQTVIGAVAVGLISVLGFAFYLTRSYNQRSLRMTESSSFNDAISSASRENILMITDQIKGDNPSAIERQHQAEQQVLGDGVRSSIISNRLIINQSHEAKSTNDHDISIGEFDGKDIMPINNAESHMKESRANIMIQLHEGKESTTDVEKNNEGETETSIALKSNKNEYSDRTMEISTDNSNQPFDESKKQAVSFEVLPINTSERTQESVTNKIESNESQNMKQRPNSVQEMINNIEHNNRDILENNDEIEELKKKTMKSESAPEKPISKDDNMKSKLNEDQLNEHFETESTVPRGQNNLELVENLITEKEPNLNYDKNDATNSGMNHLEPSMGEKLTSDATELEKSKLAENSSASISGKTSETSPIKENEGSEMSKLHDQYKDQNIKDKLSSIGIGNKKSAICVPCGHALPPAPASFCRKAKSSASFVAGRRSGCSVCVDLHATKSKHK